MAIEARSYQSQRGTAGRRIILESCPCGYRFSRGEPRHMHIATHDPADFGLSPTESQQEPDK